jgi:protein phosphatase
MLNEIGAAVATNLGNGSCEISPTRFPGTSFTVSIFQHMGDRRTQEDRFVIVPQLDTLKSCAFFGVFDGTVGDFASENVKEIVVPKLTETIRRLSVGECFRHGSVPRLGPGEPERLLGQTMKDLYLNVDDALLQRCSQHCQHYATCTSVTLMIIGDLIVVGHVGDSRIVLGKESEGPKGEKGEIVGEQLTFDHKPNLDQERQRIEQCGGMVERLQNHSNKPFIRGGDFLMRKALGEQPMQLQYSRAFGAKDLKIFGLSNTPDVRVIRMGSPQYRHCRVLILASDGLWDVCSAQQAVTVALQAVQSDTSPSEALVRFALLEQSRRKARADNITAVCVVLD